jgi:hypothetical protein
VCPGPLEHITVGSALERLRLQFWIAHPE